MSREEREALALVEERPQDVALVRGDLFPILERRVERDQRVERRTMRAVDRERALEIVHRLLRAPLLALDAPELVEDVGARLGLFFAERRQRLRERRVRRREIAGVQAGVGEAERRRLVRQVELVRRAERLQRLVVLAERRRDAPELRVEIVLLAPIALRRFAHEALDQRLRLRPLLRRRCTRRPAEARDSSLSGSASSAASQTRTALL